MEGDAAAIRVAGLGAPGTSSRVPARASESGGLAAGAAGGAAGAEGAEVAATGVDPDLPGLARETEVR